MQEEDRLRPCTGGLHEDPCAAVQACLSVQVAACDEFFGLVVWRYIPYWFSAIDGVANLIEGESPDTAILGKHSPVSDHLDTAAWSDGAQHAPIRLERGAWSTLEEAVPLLESCREVKAAFCS